MTFRLKSMPLAILQVVASGALAAAVATPALAQETASAAPQRVIVTGSLISRADRETASPVQVLTSEDILKTGKTSVAEILTDLAANGQGTLGSGFAGAFANGASGVSLRGLTVGLTLVLIDGHRMASYPLSDDSQRSFVDVSSIPFDAVDRIEVLKDGASALYGSDAVAGVVNIILKKQYKGTRVHAEAGNSQHGGGKMHKAGLSTGFGDLNTDGYNAFVTAEYRENEAIYLHQRDSKPWANGDWRARGGNDLRFGAPTALNSFLTAASTPFLYRPVSGDPNSVNNPANYQFLDPKCNFELYRAAGCLVRNTYSVLQPKSDNINVMAGFTKKLNEDWDLSLKASMFQRHSASNRGMPGAFSPTTFAGYTSLVNGVPTPLVGRVASTLIPSTVSWNKFGAPARLYGFIPGAPADRSSDNTSKATRFAADLNGSAFGWDIRSALGLTKVETEIDYTGYVNRKLLSDSLNNGSFNPLGGNTPGLQEAIIPHFSNKLESKLNYFDIAASRELMPKLGAGPLNLALGAHWHKREQNSPPPALTASATVATTFAYTIGEETNTAVFAELQATPIDKLELSASARYDHYDTYGNSFTPQAKFKWAPSKQVAVRGSFARGFRAPNPAEVGNAGSFFSFHAINDPILCANGNRNTAGNVPSACGFSPVYVQTTEAPLDPEKSKSYGLGIILEPVKDLSASFDYYNIELTGQVTSASALPSFVPTYVRSPAVPTDIATGNGTTTVGTPSVGPILYALSPYVNAGSVKTNGVEMDLRYRLRLEDLGNVTLGLNVNHMISYEITDTSGTTVQVAGTHGPSSVSGNTGNPKNRGVFTLGWDRGPLNVTTTVNWTGSFSSLDPTVGGNNCASVALDVGGRTYFNNFNAPDSYCHVPSFVATNLNMTYKLSKNWQLKASILNLFDREPPVDIATYGNAGSGAAYNASLHQAGAIGRFFSVGASYTF